VFACKWSNFGEKKLGNRDSQTRHSSTYVHLDSHTRSRHGRVMSFSPTDSSARAQTDTAASAPTSVCVAVLTVSDTRTLDTDSSGGHIVAALVGAGHQIVRRRIVTDDADQIRQWVAECVSDESIQVVITTGGTGITARDVTPDAVAPLVTKSIDGFGELFRALSYLEIGASTIQSRCVGAICNKTLVFMLPGSTNAVRLAMEKILLPQLDSRTKPCNFVSLFPRL
jgi:molybdenum cofactor biosynthesis protein B